MGSGSRCPTARTQAPALWLSPERRCNGLWKDLGPCPRSSGLSRGEGAGGRGGWRDHAWAPSPYQATRGVLQCHCEGARGTALGQDVLARGRERVTAAIEGGEVDVAGHRALG